MARLSGSTAEFLQMWQIMMFGSRPFVYDGEALASEFAPLIPSYLIDGTRRIEAAFLGRTKVIYHLCDGADFIPGGYVMEKYVITGNGGTHEVKSGRIPDEAAHRIRDGQIEKIEVHLQR